MELKRISIDTSKHIFTIHGVDRQEHPVLRREIRRSQFESFFAKLEPTEVALEACAGSHHWGRLLSRLGHRVKLIPPQYVKPFVKRSKNDRNDAEAIGEAASRPAMRTVPLKTTLDLNPIEPAWAQIKGDLRKAEARSLAQLDAAMPHALEQITPSSAQGWFRMKGYRSN